MLHNVRNIDVKPNVLFCCRKLNSHYEGDLVIDQTENVSVSETVIKALENNDADAIKNLFSVRAKDLCPDLDEGIGYMLSIYEGEFVEVTQNNSSSNKYSSGGERCIVSPVCVFKTTENYYKLTWNAWTINEKIRKRRSLQHETPDLAGCRTGSGR